MNERQPAILTMVGGILVAIGSLLPWATVSSGFGSVSLNGIEGDGKFTLVIGAVLALLGYLRFAAGGKTMIAAGLAVIALALGVFEYSNVSAGLAETNSSVIRASIGIGLYLILVGGAVGLFGALRRAPVKPPVAPSA